jgi:hypothetical protein
MRKEKEVKGKRGRSRGRKKGEKQRKEWKRIYRKKGSCRDRKKRQIGERKKEKGVK